MVYIQKLFIKNRTISHSGFNLYWLAKKRNQKNIQVFTAIQKDIVNNFIYNNQSNFINHSYCLILNIKKIHLKTRKPL